MAMESLILVANPGSSSRKYALFNNGEELARLHFEHEDGRVIGSIVVEGIKHPIETKGLAIDSVIGLVIPALNKHGIPTDDINRVAIRLVAPSEKFTEDMLVTDDVLQELESINHRAPLHINTTLKEIRQLRQIFSEAQVIAVSDSNFHKTKPDRARYYPISLDVAEEHEIVRFGYHGISLQSVVEKIKAENILMPKMVICHLGSGSSVTAVKNGKSIETTMGYSPLEGLMMATRSGSIDVAAALALKHELQLSDDHLEEYLNKKSGLLGVSKRSNDIRELLKSDDKRSNLALDMFVYRIQQAIGQMAASLDGVGCIVFTGTVGERSDPIRARIIDGLGYLNFSCDDKLNQEASQGDEIADISKEDSKPILVISTNEAEQIAKRAGSHKSL